MNRAEAFVEYQKAQKRAQRDYREKMQAGQSPYLPVLDDILQNAEVENQMPIGTLEIPLELMVGTKTSGRTAAFSSNFLPLLDTKTEFASKWVSLCEAHVEEGIRDPVRCYEYLGRFYVQEGNKRVSVLKYFGASSILATITRVVPRYSDDPVIRQYYEFMEYYPLMGSYEITFTKPGSYASLQKLIGLNPGEKWPEETRAELLSLHNWVEKAYLALGGGSLHTTVGDIILLLLRVYPQAELFHGSPAELRQKLESLWDDVLALQKDAPVRVSSAPAAPAQTGGGLLDWILPTARQKPTHLKVAFVHEKTAATSVWTSQHEFGRSQLDEVFPEQVTTAAYFDAVPGQNADELVEQAIADGADLVFTTSPKLVGASLRAALEHPQVHILNCSLEMPYASIRTYYTRVYEAKFITGAIAGAMSMGDTIGYLAETPMYGSAANINAFALGMRMANPRAKLKLAWSCLPGDAMRELTDAGITIISGRDAPVPGRPQREFGTFQLKPGGMLQDLATPFWHWGQFYENVVRTVLNGGWQRDKSGNDGRAVNYWWGMNSGVMDVLLSRELPPDVRHLADILRAGVISGGIDPFACRITAQDGCVKNQGVHGFEPEAIMRMDWLCDAVDGHIPCYDEMIEEAKPLYRMQGLHRDSLPAEEKETVL